MKVKKYVGKNMQDTIFKVKSDLGSDAIILDTRKIKKGGFLGFFGNEKIEVLAALEEPEQKDDQTLSEINDIKNMVSDLNNKYVSNDFSSNLSDDLAYTYNYLDQQNIATELNQKIITELKQESLEDLKEIYNTMRSKLVDIIDVSKPISINSQKKIVVFAGPTGVGKTTTIAKLAAKFALEKEKQVGLITSDTFRIAAVEQLKTYSDIVNIPLQVLYDDQQLTEIINNKYSDHELILIDTAGSSWNDRIQIGHLKTISNHDLVDEVHLLVSMNTKSEDLKSIINHFSEINPDKLLLTKLDETTTYGDIINLKNDYNLPYSYFTYGQDVPDDIKIATPVALIDYLMRDFYE